MKHIFFDLDGTLLSLNTELFSEIYFHGLATAAMQQGFDGRAVSEAILKGTYAMIKNDGAQNNEDVFWAAFEASSGIKKVDILEVFNHYYAADFAAAGAAAAKFEEVPRILRVLKEKGYKLYLTTNPLFPINAIKMRAKWAGLDLKDFEYVTTYDNSHFCKPNPLYFKEVMEKFGLDPKDILMVGNNVAEDGCIRTLGSDCILLSKELINTKQSRVECPLLTHAQFLKWAENLESV